MNGRAYYNELDPFAAAWLRRLIDGGHIAGGDVDERDIRTVRPDDVRGYTQCHWFAGIGGWSYAFRLAGIPDSRPVWSGSCPCQPFSEAGKRRAFSDPRHLWPEWFRIIRERKPAIVFGEQAPQAIGWGWLDAVAHDLETAGYAFGAAIVPACAVGSKQVRDRIWFLADTAGERWVTERREQRPQGGNETRPLPEWPAEPGVPCVADDVPGRMGYVRGFGNSINPVLAATFIRAFLQSDG